MSELLDNRAQRIRTLAHIIKQLHQGAAPESVKAQLAELVRHTDAGEIAAMEQQLMAEGMSVDEVRSMCDLHADVLREVMAAPPRSDVPPGHPVDQFRRENAAVRHVLARMRMAIRDIKALPPDADGGVMLSAWRSAVNDLMDLDKHYQRKENLLFSCLERHGITGPSKVMWAKDDEVRQAVKALAEALGRKGATAGELAEVADRLGEPAMHAVAGMIDKEEHILLPMALQTLTEDEWGEIWVQSPQYGWCLVDPRTGYQPPAAMQPVRTHDWPRDEAVVFPTGSLNFEQLLGVFRTLPVDLTFVDAEDRVRFFSEGPDRIFARSKAIIGRKVQHCHPPSSVDVVERILDDFRTGRQDVAEFWITHHGRFVHIRYFAVRDDQGRYLGTLEVTQDLTRPRALTGERRLLQYERDAAASAPAG